MTNGLKIGVLYTCSDWRLHQPEVWAAAYASITKALGVDRLDVVAVPGPDGACVFDERKAEGDVHQGHISLLATAHKAHAIAVAPHERCAGHPVSDAQHRTDALQAAARLREALPDFTGPIVPLVWGHINDNEWTIEAVTTPSLVMDVSQVAV